MRVDLHVGSGGGALALPFLHGARGVGAGVRAGV